MTFRVHLSDGSKRDVDAESPEQARKIAMKHAAREVIVLKIKRLREK